MINTALGPRPARSSSGRGLSPSRASLLETLQAQPDPTSLQALVEMTGLHANTVREHLDALIRRGLVTREQARPSGRGRPGWLYRATHRGPDAPPAEYAGLAATLAAVVVRTSPDPARDARAAGADWGRRLAHESGEPDGDGPDAARHQVSRIFDRMGFEPEPDPDDPTTMRLTRCPLLEAAHQNRDVVCSVHLGIAEGAMEVYGADGSGSQLVPFAEPGACLLHLRPASGQ